MDLDVDSYYGIVLDVKFEVYAEMSYEGTMMNYTAMTRQVFSVRNNRDKLALGDEKETKDSTIEPVRAPRLKIEF